MTARLSTRILLVEDEAIVARDLAQRLEGLGYEITGTAASGEEALSLAQSTRPNLVFMDITIQGPMDGVETAKQLSKQMDVPIVFLTAHTDTGTIQRAKQARPYGYLIKPLDERDLLTTVEMAVSRHKTDVPARLLQQAFSSAGIGVVMASATAPAFGITFCNSAFERMCGYAAAEVLGQSPWFLEGAGTDQAASARLREAVQGQRECQVSYVAYRKDGTSFWTDVALSPVHSPSGELTHFLFCHTDASARKQAEDERSKTPGN
jgi:PAS domain S-box-containing protein